MDKVKSIAERLNGIEYRDDIPKDIIEEAKANRIVIVFGRSDDLMEFEGAIYDEVGCYEGGSCVVNYEGKIGAKGGKTIRALWCDKKSDFTWSYKTKIPHETFDMFDDDEKYCRGIVFSLDSLNQETNKNEETKMLKILPQYFEEVIKGNKRAELRFNDRDFKVGDIYELEEYDGKTYTGRSVTVRITHILEGFEGLIKGWCMFSFITIGEAKEASEPPKDAGHGELLRLVAENPSLPIVAMVYSEVVQDDGYAWWLGSFGRAYVDEYVIFKSNKYDDGKYYTKDDQDEIEEIIAECVSEENPQMSESEIFAEAHRQAEALPWTKAIIVYIDLPE